MQPSLAARGSARAETDASRMLWIDMARGTAEVSVVTFHVLQAMTNAGLTPAGLFVEYSLRKGANAYFTGKTQRVIWPYLVWAHVYSIYWWIRPSPFDHRTPADVLMTALNPGSHLWFLQSLFLYYAAVYFLLKRGLRTTLAVGLLVAVATPLLPYEELRRIAYLFLFFVLGIGFRRLLRARGFPFGAATGAALVLLAIVLPVLITGAFGYSKYLPVAIPASLVGVMACLAISRALVHVPVVNRLLILFGTFLLEIYCAHVVMSSATRQVLVGVFHLQAFWPIFLLSTTAGLFLPLALALGLRKCGLDCLFEWPKHLFRREPATAPQNF